MLRLKQRRAILAAVLSVVGVGTAFAQLGTVYVTYTGEQYHRASCSSLRHNKIETPLAQAAARYAPCQICKPPVPVGATASRAPLTVTPAKPVERWVQSAHCEATATIDTIRSDLRQSEGPS